MSQAESSADPGSGIPLLKVSGIEVQIQYSWFLIFALVTLSLAEGYLPRAHPDLTRTAYWAAGVVASLLFFASILLHELSHAWMAQRAGIEVPAITLFLFGGVSHIGREADDPATELRIAAVGPLTSFALAGVFWGLYVLTPAGAPALVGPGFLYLSWINMALGIFNLLPGLPLDGGRVLRAVAWWRTGSFRRGTRVASRAGQGIAIGLMILGGLQVFGGNLIGGLWLVLIGLFLRGTAEASYQSLVILQSLEDVEVQDVALRDPVSVSPELSLDSLVNDYFLAHGFRAFPVVEDDEVLGLITIDALRELPPERRSALTVKEQMTPLSKEMIADPKLPLADALKRLESAPGQRLLVLRSGRLVGLLSKSALARFLEIQQVLDDFEEEDTGEAAERA